MPIRTVTAPDGSCVHEGPCTWDLALCEPTEAGSDECYSDRLEALDSEMRAIVEQSAVNWLWNLTGRRYGACELRLRPCVRPSCDPCRRGARPDPWHDSDGWHNASPCGDDCCDTGCELQLPGPVCDVTEVLIDGVVRDAREYRIDNRNRLVRVGEVKQLPTSVGIGLFLSGAGQVGPAFPAYCNVTPTPDTVAGFDPLAGGCYTVASTTQSLQWTSVRDVTVSYEENDATPGSRALVVGDSMGGDQYQFPTTALTSAGQSMVSTARGDGTYARVTKVSGPGTIQRVGNPLILTGDVRFRVEILRDELVYGDVCWPTCQTMEKPSTEEGTFEVVYRRGVAVPAGGQLAAGVLAAELARACLSDTGCRLPQRIQNLTRQGVSMTLLDPSASEGLQTGIWLVDSWVASVTVPRRQQGSVFVDPQNLYPYRQTTWSAP